MRIKNIDELEKLPLGKAASSKIRGLLLPAEEKKSKYNNKKEVRFFRGEKIIFDSIKEAKYFDDLYLKEKANIINNLSLQPKFEIIPKISYGGKTYRKIVYIADFSYTKDCLLHVVDVKGFRTDVYQIKKRLFLQQNPYVIFIEG